MHILIIEDDTVFASLLTKYIKRTIDSEVIVVVAATIADASDILYEKTFNLILLDLGLPDSRGIESFSTIKPLTKDIPVIIITASNEKEFFKQLAEKGAADYLPKSELNEDLFCRIVHYTLQRYDGIMKSRKVSDELKRREFQLNSIFKALPVLIAFIDEDGKFKMWNAECENVLGYTEKEALEEINFQNLIHPGGIGFHEFRDMIQGESRKYSSIEFKMKRNNGEIRIISWKELHVDIPGKEHGLWIIGLDRTDKKIAQDELKKKADEAKTHLEIIQNREDRLNTIVNGLSEAILAVDNNTNIMLMNHEFEKITNRKLNDCIGESLHKVIDNKALLIQFEELLNNSSDNICKENTISIPMEKDMQLHYFTVRISDILHNKEGIIGRVITLNDQSERIRVEQMRQSFLNNVSHELRTPVTSILSLTNLLYGMDLNKEMRQYLELLKECEITLLQQLDMILDFSKLEKDEITLNNDTFNLMKTCERASDIYKPRALEKNITFTADYNSIPPCELIGDEKWLLIVLNSLISNAVKFTREGNVRFTVELQSENNRSCTILFKITDEGIGIEKSKWQVIFEGFTQLETSASRRYSGAGLGLAVAKRIVDLMDGKIWLESEQNKGSVFFVLLTFSK